MTSLSAQAWRCWKRLSCQDNVNLTKFKRLCNPVGDALQSENHEFLVSMPRIQPPVWVWTVWKWRTDVPFVKSVSVKCCPVWLSNPDLWLQRGRMVLWLRHKTSSSGSSWFCWRLPYVTVGRTFLPAPCGKWTSVFLHVSRGWEVSPALLTYGARAGARQNKSISAPLGLLGVICMVL